MTHSHDSRFVFKLRQAIARFNLCLAVVFLGANTQGCVTPSTRARPCKLPKESLDSSEERLSLPNPRECYVGVVSSGSLAWTLGLPCRVILTQSPRSGGLDLIGTSNRRTTRTIERLLLGRYEPTPEEQLGTLEWQELHLPPELENLWLGEPAALQLVDQNRAIIALSTPGDLVLLDVTGLPERPVISRHWISETINIRGGEMDIAIRYVDPPVVILATSVAGSSTRIAAHRLSDLTPLWERELPGADTLALSASPNEIRAVTTDWSAHSGTSLTLTRDREGTSKSIQLPFLTEALDVHALFMAEGQLVLAGRLHGGVTRVGLFSEGGRLLSAVEFEGVVPQALNRGLNGQIQVVLQCYPSATHLRTLGLDPDTLATCSNSIVLREKRQVRRVRPVLLAEDSSIYAVGSE